MGKETQHTVTLTYSFSLMSTEVTQSQFLTLMGYNPSINKKCGLSCPVENVNWHEAAAYCNALSSKLGKKSCYSCSGKGAAVQCQEATAYSGSNITSCPGIRLPTEAEWEYAYRAGTKTALYNGNLSSCSSDVNADKIAWYANNSGGKTQSVGKKLKNAWGLYDMSGNVKEWGNDKYTKDLGSSPTTDPTGPVKTVDPWRVVRGGGWHNPTVWLRAASRIGQNGINRRDYMGFRCVRTL